jgi:hypothetical protein
MKIPISKMANKHITHRRGMAAPDGREGGRDGVVVNLALL